jgi:hypothetical protein
LVRELRESTGLDRQRLAGQVEILYKRARLIRLSITMGAVSVLLVSALIILLFVTAVMKLEVGPAISLLFICCMFALFVSLCSFIVEIHLSLKALKLELGYDKPAPR